jgi:hypothetical protein
MDKHDINVGSGLVGAPACGDGELFSHRFDQND